LKHPSAVSTGKLTSHNDVDRGRMSRHTILPFRIRRFKHPRQIPVFVQFFVDWCARTVKTEVEKEKAAIRRFNPALTPEMRRSPPYASHCAVQLANERAYR
jgi:hypothetical protein